MQIIRAWAGSRALKNPTLAIETMLEADLDGLDIVVNDFAGKRRMEPFYLRREDRIRALADMVRDTGREVRLMTWMQPFEEFIRMAADRLIPLATKVGAEAIQIDAEEAWNECKGPGVLSHADAAELLGYQFADRPCALEVNGIPHAPQTAIKPLADVCDVVIPQCYVTGKGWGKWNVRPHHVTGWLNKWRDRYAPDGKPVVYGFAAYSQKKLGNRPTGEIMIEAARKARDWGCTTAVAWSLSHIRRDKDVLRTVRDMREILDSDDYQA
jgi:hypothetical protein